jgi:hypothetical protein
MWRISAEVAVEDQIEAPGRELAEYRLRLNKKRRELTRSVMSELIAGIDNTVRSLSKTIPKKPNPARKIKTPAWEKLKGQIQEVETLLGSGAPRPSRWSDMRRHLHFGAMQDLIDVVRLDWPEVKAGLSKGLYDHDEPLPVEVSDLGTLAAAQPKGHVVAKLRWESLSEEDYERLVFSLISSAPGYENPEWLTRTNAPDRGRDLSVTRIVNDPLSGAIRSPCAYSMQTLDDKEYLRCERSHTKRTDCNLGTAKSGCPNNHHERSLHERCCSSDRKTQCRRSGP